MTERRLQGPCECCGFHILLNVVLLKFDFAFAIPVDETEFHVRVNVALLKDVTTRPDG
jgi:hypothetical protein